MREFLAPRSSNSGLMARSPFQNLPKDDDLSAIMARRRQIADSGKDDGVANSISGQNKTSSSEFQPKSNRMTTVLNTSPSLDNKRSDHSRNSRSEHSRTSVSSDFRPKSNRMTAALEQKGSDHGRNEASSELLMAMSKRRTKVEDTSIPVVSPRQKIRNQNYKHVPMSPMLQEKLDKRKLMVETINPLPILKAERKDVKRNIPSNEERSMMSSMTSMTSTSVRHATFQSKLHNENDESSSESSVSRKFHSDAEKNKYPANSGRAFLDDGYQSTSDESGAQLANIIMAHHRRSPRQKAKPSATASYDESGETFAEEKESSNKYPVVSDGETEDELFETATVQNERLYGKSASVSASESDATDDEDIEESEYAESDDDMMSNDNTYEEQTVEEEFLVDDDEEGVEAATEDEDIEEPEFAESDDDMMSNDNTYEERTVEEEFLVDEESAEEETVDDEEYLPDRENGEEQTVCEEQTVFGDELNGFPNVRSEGFGQPQQFDEIDDDAELGLEQEGSKDHNCENRDVTSNDPYILGTHGSSSTSSRNSSSESENKIRGSISADVFGGKIVDGRVDRDVPIGDGDDSSYDMNAKMASTHETKSKNYSKQRVCSWTVVIGLVMIGSIAIGVGIGVFFSKKSSDGNGNSDPIDEPTSTPEINDPNTAQVPPEQAATYSVICPKLTDCAALLDKQSAQGRAFDWLFNESANPQLNDMSEDSILRRYALATIYYSTEGDSWVENTNWLSNLTECDWFSSSASGSGCGIEGQTIFSSLELDNNNVTGVLPFEVSLLSAVLIISIRNPVGTDPYLHGTLPSVLGKLTSITSLSLSGNQFSSGIPVELGGCVNLETLDLSENGLNGELPLSLSTLTNLTTLNLEGNFFSGRVDPTIFEGANALLELNLERNRLTGIPETINKLHQLQKLNLASNNLSTVPLAITLFSKLTYLDLSANGFTGSIPVQFGTMSSLSHLDLSDNKFSGMIPVELGNLVDLETTLDLSANELSGPIPSRFGQLVQLQRLRLDQNRLSGTIPSDLAALSNIQEIRFDSNDLTGVVPMEICTLYNKIRPVSYADCNELQNATCITNCCTLDGGCVCQFEKTEPLLCIKRLS
jgi:Leucine-rich repeat (LRR) protein